MLTTFVVNTPSDSAGDAAGETNGLLSLREAIVASETNTAFGDAPAGEQSGDVIRFAKSIKGNRIRLSNGEFGISDKLRIASGDSRIIINAASASRIFNISSEYFVATDIRIATVTISATAARYTLAVQEFANFAT